MNQTKKQAIAMSRKETREYNVLRERTLQREAYKKQKYAHDFLCDCRRCEPGIITKWRKINVKEMA